MVTDEDEEKDIEEQAHDAGYRLFRDRPIPKPQFKWTYDPCMPSEWNKVISAMRECEGTWSHQTQGCYCNATKDKMSEPEDFQYQGAIDNISMDQVKAQTVTRLPYRKEDWDFKKLRAKFERPNLSQPN